jgi:hypothetical protein
MPINSAVDELDGVSGATTLPLAFEVSSRPAYAARSLSFRLGSELRLDLDEAPTNAG